MFIKEAVKISLMGNWNNYDKLEIKAELKRKLKNELEKMDFINKKKFDIIDEEIDKVLKLMGLI